MLLTRHESRWTENRYQESINPCFTTGQKEIDGVITDFIYPSNLFSHRQFAVEIM